MSERRTLYMESEIYWTLFTKIALQYNSREAFYLNFIEIIDRSQHLSFACDWRGRMRTHQALRTIFYWMINNKLDLDVGLLSFKNWRWTCLPRSTNVLIKMKKKAKNAWEYQRPLTNERIHGTHKMLQRMNEKERKKTYRNPGIRSSSCEINCITQ